MKTKVRLLNAFVAAAALVSAVTVVLVPGSASAGIETNCTIRPGGPVILFYGQGQTGASICLNNNIYNMASPALYFPAPGAGAGSRVWDNAGSAMNFDTGWRPQIWENPGYTGASYALGICCDEGMSPWSLGAVTNKNSSLSWFPN